MGIVDREVLEVGLVLVLDIACGCSRGRQQPFMNKLAAGDKWVAVPTFMFRDYSPNVLWSGDKGVMQGGNGSQSDWRAVYQGNHGGVPAPIQHFLQPGLKRAELASLRSGIPHERGVMGVDDGGESIFILTSNHQDQITNM